MRKSSARKFPFLELLLLRLGGHGSFGSFAKHAVKAADPLISAAPPKPDMTLAAYAK
jgi:hypothetical protein